MEELAKPAIEVYKNNSLRFIPDRFGKVYMHWLENIRDWCISRQLWWGHRIPAYYCQKCGHIEVTKDPTGLTCSKCGSTDFKPVSYTHLDVYKRQAYMMVYIQHCCFFRNRRIFPQSFNVTAVKRNK